MFDAVQTFYRYYPVADRDRDWGLFATTVGQSRLGPRAEYPPAGHPKDYSFRTKDGRVLPNFQIIYISAGAGWFKSATTKRISVKAGDLLFLFPGIWHSYAPHNETGWDEHWVGFDGALARRLMRHRFFASSKPLLQVGRESRLMGWFNELIEVTHSNDPALQQTMSGIIMQILAHLYCMQQSRLAANDRELPFISQAVTRLNQNFAGNIDFDCLARELKVSYSWFRRSFTHHTGLAPHQYLLEIRLAHARELLSAGLLSVKEIADRTGFADSQYFCRMFRKKVGLAPMSWRRRFLNQNVH